MIRFKNEDSLLSEIASDLTDTEYGTNWNVVIPPGVGEDIFVDRLLQELQSKHPTVPLAVLSPDTIPTAQGYVRALHRQWTAFLDLPRLSENPRSDELFDELMSLLPSGHLAIQVIKRFHKVVNLMDFWVLGKMRDAEREKRFRTFTCTPVSIEELKARWDDDHNLTVSDYGQNLTSQNAEIQDLDNVLASTESVLPPHLVKYVYEISGGFPAIFEVAISRWRRLGCPPLTPVTRDQLRQVSIASLDRFIRWLDTKHSSRYRDSVIDIHQGFDAESSAMILEYHPWKNFLLDGEGLRSESVGDAAVGAAVFSKIRKGSPQLIAAEGEQRAKAFYRRSKFVNAAEILDELQQSFTLRPDLIAFLSCSKVMASLLHGSVASEDTDWHSVFQECEQAGNVINPIASDIVESDFLKERLLQLKEVAADFTKASSHQDSRLVDILCGLRKGNVINCRGGLLLLTTKYESSVIIAGNASALQTALSLPEQVFRVLVFWSLGINYYSAPAGMEDSWDTAIANWPEARGTLISTPPGEQFTSLLAFAYLASAEWKKRGFEFELSDFRKTESVFTKLENLRNPKAHSYVKSDKKARKWFFDTAKYWLERATICCPDSCTRDSLLAIVAPLPIPTQKR